MRIALVSPYSWTYPGGVTRHIEALAERFIADGHHVRVLAPYDPVDILSTALHRGAGPQPLQAPDYLVPLGRTVGFKANGAVSNLSITPYGVATLHTELRRGNYDVVHVHEPVAPLTGWVASDWTRLPLVGTFHSFSESRLSNGLANAMGARRVLNRLHVRIAVSEAAAWTGRRFFGGHYRVIPNGVHVDPAVLERAIAAAGCRAECDGLRIVFVGQAVERKGLPLLLRAFEALREAIPCELTVIGPTREELAPLLVDDRGVRALGKVDDERKAAELQRADVLCAPSLRGESFGMVLTEAFAAGTPVVASDIAGYRDVVSNAHDGVLVPRGDATALAEALRELWFEPSHRVEMGRHAAESAKRYAWPRVAAEVLDVYAEAQSAPQPQTAVARAAVRVGARPADLLPAVKPARIPSLEPPLRGRSRPLARTARRAVMILGAFAVVYAAYLALKQIGVHNIASSLVNSSPAWVLAALGIMCASMVLRACSWHAILRAALPKAPVRMRDALQGTFIGVLMSATLPARLGELSRALIVARRTGRPREHLPTVLGTIVSQTMLNLFALVILGVITFSSVGLFHGRQDGLLLVTIAPVALLLVVLLAPVLLARGAGSRFSSVHA
ncbi:MAG: glycosyltransferase, partial [Candidatus Eremiobacteraeota bacterium]|nr:glycosyltransferase [Candidatus Eremiobacteraeota bacterium]